MNNLFVSLLAILCLWPKVIHGQPALPKPVTPAWLVPKTNQLNTVPRVVILKWHYPANASNYWWDLQTSTNLTTWTTIASNTGPADITVTNKGGNHFFRMKGRL